MKTKEIHSLWTQFITKYPNVFQSRSVKKNMKAAAGAGPGEKTDTPKHPRIKSEISVLHQKYKTMRSDTLSALFKSEPVLWSDYHKLSEENEESFPTDEIPRNKIISELKKIKTKRTISVIDMGCGKADIARSFAGDDRFHFQNYDHISIDETVVERDIGSLVEEDDTVEICILCLAMWGSNSRDYVKEAYRVLESNGRLYIVEPTKRWTTDETTLENTGDKLTTLLSDVGFQIQSKTIEKFSYIVCVKI
jgi:hypothetical protein